MTLAEIRTAIHDLCKEWTTDSGALLETGDVLLDFYINMATEIVTLDLIEYLPENFVTYEDITLVASTANYNLTAEWLQIWCMQKNVTDENPQPIPYIDIDDRPELEYVGETAEDPEAFYLKGTTIYFVPTPSTAKTNYARCWIVIPEAASMASGGPVYIPRMAHKLIVLQAVMLIGMMNESSIATFTYAYTALLERVRGTLGSRIQQQPRFIKTSFLEKRVLDTRDKALYDKSDFFD